MKANRTKIAIGGILLVMALISFFTFYFSSEAPLVLNDHQAAQAQPVSKKSSRDAPRAVSRKTDGELYGRVVSGKGAAISSASIVVVKTIVDTSRNNKSAIVYDALSKSDGSFSIPRASLNSPECLYFVVRHKGYDASVVSVVDFLSQRIVKDIVLEGHPKSGMVVGPQGSPIPNSQVQIEIPIQGKSKTKYLRFDAPVDKDSRFMIVDGEVCSLWIRHEIFGDFIDRRPFENDRNDVGDYVFSFILGSQLQVEFQCRDSSVTDLSLKFKIRLGFASRWIYGESNVAGIAHIAKFPEALSFAHIETMGSDLMVRSSDDLSTQAGGGLTPHLTIDGAGGARRLVVNVFRGTSIKGVVVDSRTAIPVSGIKVIIGVLEKSGQNRRIVTDSKGEFRFTGLPVGWYKLATEGDGYSIDIQLLSSQYPIETSPLGRVLGGMLNKKNDDIASESKMTLDPRWNVIQVFAGPESEAEVRIPVKRSGSITGKIVDSSGHGVSSTRVGISREHDVFGTHVSRIKSDSDYSVVTNEDGEFRFDDVPIGRWRILCAPSGMNAVRSELYEVKSGEELGPVILRVDAGSVFVFSVHDRSGNPIEGIEISLIESQHSSFIDQTIVDRLFTNELGLAFSKCVGTFHYCVRFPNLASLNFIPVFGTEKTLTQNEKTGERIKTIILRDALQLKGQVMEPNGAALSGVDIAFQRLSDKNEWVDLLYSNCRTDASGNFSQNVSRDGVYRVKEIGNVAIRLPGNRLLIYDIVPEVNFSPNQLDVRLTAKIRESH